MQTYFSRIMLLFFALLLVACTIDISTSEDPLLGRRVMIWHSWNESEAKELNKLLDQFSASHNVTVIRSVQPPDVLSDLFFVQSSLSLGPDLLIGSSQWVAELADEGLIQDLSQRENIQQITSVYRSNAIDTLRYKDGLYGIPLSLHTLALYYNQKMVDNPPDTLDDLLLEAENGKQIALNTEFEYAFWGVQAFGGTLFDETEAQRVALNEGAFANWLDWLKQTQNQTNIILDDDDLTLFNLFKEGEVAYYVGPSAELGELQQALGEDVVGVVPLPKGPNGSSGPFLRSEALMMSSKSSDEQAQLALELAAFLTKVPQQTKLARTTGRIPANSHVRIDPQVYPAVAGFLAQSKTAVPLPNIEQLDQIYEEGNKAYLQALTGEQGSQEVASALTEEVNNEAGFEATPEPAGFSCPSGHIKVWHAWSDEETKALTQVRDKFISLCATDVSIQLIAQPDDDELLYAFQQVVRGDESPDLLIASNSITSPLVLAGLVSDLSDLVAADFWQRYLPQAQASLSYQDKAYGLPASMQVMGLYYNKEWVSDPARDLDDLLNQATSEHPVILPVEFSNVFWGFSAFGVKLFDQTRDLTVIAEASAEWLSWLQQAAAQPGMVLTDDVEEGAFMFAEGQAAYFAGPHSLLNELQDVLGQDKVGVAPLPAGSKGEAGPILTVDALMLNARGTPQNRALAFEFAKYVASVESQTLLMEQANLVPANVNVDTSQYPAIEGFLEQTKTAIVPPIHAEAQTVFEWGDFVYEHVLTNGLKPIEAVRGFFSFVNEVNDITVEQPEDAAQESCLAEGKLLLWHSWSDRQADTLAQIMADFAQRCPTIELTAQFVPAETLPHHLAEAVQAGTGPDFFLASHDLIEPLREQALIKPITPWINDSTLVQFLPWAIRPLQQEAEWYGLPNNLHTVALYVNPSLVNLNDLPETVDDLLSAATPESQVALDTTFYGALWGVSAFGGTLKLENLRSDEESSPLESQRGLANWLAWLQAAQNRPGMLLSQDQELLRQRFATNQAAYLIAGADALAPLQSALGAGNVSVEPLPAGPNGQAKPFLGVEAFLFSASARDEQTQLALKFAEFATSGSSQSLFAQRADFVPASTAALADLLGRSVIGNFAIQTIDTIPLPPRSRSVLMFEAGNRLYQNALEDGEDAVRATEAFGEELRNTPKLDLFLNVQKQTPVCEREGDLLLWHSLPIAAQLNQTEALSPTVQADVVTPTGQTDVVTPTVQTDVVTPRAETKVLTRTVQTEVVTPTVQTDVVTPTVQSESLTITTASDVLTELIANFKENCPGIQVEANYVPADEWSTQLAAATEEGSTPDFFVASHDLIVPLSDANLIKPITSLVKPEHFDQHLPQASSALQHNDERYGLPLSLDVMALYYNTNLVTDTISSLDELNTVVTTNTLVALDSSFYGAHWGISAFGGQLFDETGQLAPEQEGIVAWLEWLKAANEQPGMLLSADQQALQQRFAAGDVAYLIAGSDALAPLQAALGANNVGVVTLPTGAAGNTKPLLRVNGFLFSQAASEEQTELALAFAEFASSDASQLLFAEKANLVPTHYVAITSNASLPLGTFVTQASTSTLLPAKGESLTAWDDLYSKVLSGTLTPQEAVNDLIERINETK